ncbi:MAG: helix-turn-helix domain-containing protein [Oscillospiraceae bacterium]|nr:helix-turn-helix domain-containing protein [Oscillospiraceae bacterium]
MSRTSVYKLFKRSDFPAVRIGRMLRVEQSKFDKWLEASSVSAEEEEKLPF